MSQEPLAINNKLIEGIRLCAISLMHPKMFSISSFPVDTTGALLLELLFVVSASVKYRIAFLRRYFRTKTVPDHSLFVLFIDAIRIGTKMAAEEDLLENPTQECRAGARTEAP